MFGRIIFSKVSPEWHEIVGTGVSVSWPLGIAGKGNQGVAELVEHTPNSIGYTELTYAVANGLSYGSVMNRSGQLIKAEYRQRNSRRRRGRR